MHNFLDFVVSSAGVQLKRDKRLHYSEKFPGFCCVFCKNQRAIEDYIILFPDFGVSSHKKTTLFIKKLDYSEKFTDFVLSSAGVKDR